MTNKYPVVVVVIDNKAYRMTRDGQEWRETFLFSEDQTLQWNGWTDEEMEASARSPVIEPASAAFEALEMLEKWAYEQAQIKQKKCVGSEAGICDMPAVKGDVYCSACREAVNRAADMPPTS